MRVHDLLRKVAQDKAFFIGPTPFYSLRALVKGIKKIDDTTFMHHVSEHKNDFYNWTKNVYKHRDLSAELINCRTREAVITCMEGWIQKAEKEMREQQILEAVVKRKVKELMEKPLYVPPAEIPMDPLKLYTSQPSMNVTVKKENLSPMYRISKKPSPEALAQMIASREKETVVKKSVKQLFERQKYHPKNIPSTVPVPKLWELKPVKKLDKKIDLRVPSRNQKVPSLQSLSKRPKVNVNRSKMSPLRSSYQVKVRPRPVVAPRMKPKAPGVNVSHYPNTKSDMSQLLVQNAPDAKSQLQKIQDLKRAQRTSRDVTAQSPTEMIGHLKEVFKHDA